MCAFLCLISKRQIEKAKLFYKSAFIIQASDSLLVVPGTLNFCNSTQEIIPKRGVIKLQGKPEDKQIFVWVRISLELPS